MSEHFYTPEMEGEKPFRCYVCNELLIANIDGEYILDLKCRRCKTMIHIECKKPLPDSLVVKFGELAQF